MRITHADINATADVSGPTVQRLLTRFSDRPYATVYEGIINAYVLDWLTPEEQAAARTLFRGEARKKLQEYHKERWDWHAGRAAYHAYIAGQLTGAAIVDPPAKEETTRPTRVIRIRDSK
jgi:hypothetical protein